MTSTVLLNGTAIHLGVAPEVDWQAWRAALDAHLADCGWVLASIRVDGRSLAPGGAAPADLGGSPRVEVTAGPAHASVEALRQQLQPALADFRVRFTALGEQFSRGQWREPVEQLGTLLGELLTAHEGLCLVARASGEGEPEIEDLRALLGGLSALIQRRGWVEVSDLLLYELVPLLTEWDSLLTAQE